MSSRRNPHHILKIVTFILTCIFARLPFSTGINCYECGSLESIIPSTSSTGCDRSLQTLSTCRYDVDTDPTAIRQKSLLISNYLESSPLSNGSLTEVCYVLRGNFRRAPLVMGGCDAMPISELVLDEMDSLPDVNTTWHCFDSSFKVWFETEMGAEEILDSRLCICDTDYCNFEERPNVAGIKIPFLSLWLASTLFLIVVADLVEYFMI